MTKTAVLAVDFGTANTYLSRCGLESPSPQGYQLQQGGAGVDSILLYRPAGKTLIGSLAANTFGSTPASHRSGWQVRSQFKPDIVSSVMARQAAIDFLTTILTNAEESKLHINPASSRVIFGVPSEASIEYIDVLKEVALVAGFGEIETHPEPNGALAFHIASGQIPLRQALSGGLVVDFGGGTCDFSMISRGKLLQSWGDFELGGRLFDDLFFQWFVESNPQAVSDMDADGATFFVHACVCREMKELFSVTMERDRTVPVPYVVSRYGQMNGMTWSEFLQRASRYRMSAFLKEQRLAMSVPLGRFEADIPVDLLGWFKDSLTSGLRKVGMQRDVDYVLLTGGSSMWPFVNDIVAAELQVTGDRVIRSSNPYAAISEGLAALPALQSKFDASKLQIEKGLSAFFSTKIEPLLGAEIATIVEGISEELTRRIFDQCIEPEIEAFRKNGGSVASLKKGMEATMATMDLNSNNWIEEKFQRFVNAMASKVLEETHVWLASNGVKVAEEGLKLTSQSIGIGNIALPDVMKDLGTAIKVLSGTVAALVSANIAGGTGLALLIKGPIGLVIGAVLGLIIAYLAVRFGKEKAIAMAESTNIHALVARMVIPGFRIKKMRSEVKEDLSKTIAGKIDSVKAKIRETLEVIVEKEIKALTVFQNM